jgi:hypothetical protein
MPYVGGPFQHDIFVSYSHGDVVGDGQALLKQWSQGFANELKRELQAFPEIGGQIKIFLDNDHRPGHGVDPLAPLSDDLQQEIASAAILTILMSPHYLGSRWCRQEREWWIAAQQAHELPYENRIAVARVWPTQAAWPKGLVDRSGNEYPGVFFFDRTNSETRPQPFAWPKIDSETREPFRDALLEYVGWIRHRLRLKQRQEEEAQRQKLRAPAGQAIYLHGR